MRRRRLLLGVGALALLGLVGFLVLRYAFSPTPGVTEENFEWLYHGMTESEVEALFGGPGEYWLLGARVGERVPKCWRGDKVRGAVVYLDDEGIVYDAYWTRDYKDHLVTAQLHPVSLWDRLRRLLPW